MGSRDSFSRGHSKIPHDTLDWQRACYSCRSMQVSPIQSTCCISLGNCGSSEHWSSNTPRNRVKFVGPSKMVALCPELGLVDGNPQGALAVAQAMRPLALVLLAAGRDLDAVALLGVVLPLPAVAGAFLHLPRPPKKPDMKGGGE